MSKLVAFLVAAAGASTVSVGGTFLLKKGVGGQTDSSNSGGDGSNQGQSPTSESLTLYESVDTFKKAKGDKCVHGLFSDSIEMENLNGGGTTTLPTDNATSLNEYFGSTPSANGEETQGCLIINWQKTTADSGDKWKGTFTWSWAFKNEGKGFVVFGVAKTHDTEQKINLTGLTYLLSKDNSEWKVKYYKEETAGTGKEIANSSNDFDSKLPKAHAEIQKSLTDNNKNYWGFLSDNEDLSKICGTSGCPTSTQSPVSYRFKWDWQKDGGAQKITDWCVKLDWWSKLFSNANLDLSNKLNSFTGTWTKK